MSKPRDLWKLCLIRWRMILLVVTYLALVFMIARFWTAQGESEHQYVASKKLIKNRRLMPGDIKEPPSGPGRWGWFLPNREALEGKYVINDIPQANVISIDNLGTSPDMKLDDSLRPLIFSLETQPQLAQFLNAESTVDVLGIDPNPLAQDLKVHAVVCESPAHADKNTGTCYAILAMSLKQEATVNSKKEKLRLVLTETSQ